MHEESINLFVEQTNLNADKTLIKKTVAETIGPSSRQKLEVN